jgi:HEAT repeat protein
VRRALSATSEGAYWACVEEIQRRGTTEELNAAMELLSEPSEAKRELGAVILGQLGLRIGAVFPERRDLLLDLLREDSSDDLLETALFALGHARDIEDPTGTRTICRYADHPNRDVRRAAVHALLCHEDRYAIGAMIRLSKDAETEVRDWVTFGLGTQIDLDRPRIRAALRARLSYEDATTRAEALVGLAKRRDPGVVDRLMEELHRENPNSLVFEAVVECGDVSLLEPLEAQAKRSRDDPRVDPEWLRRLEKTIGSIRAKAGRRGARCPSPPR